MNTRRPITPDSEIEYLMLPTRAYSTLCKQGYTKIRDILRHTPRSLRKVPGIGWVSAEYIELRLHQIGYQLHEDPVGKRP